jgi:hypothetical protein
MAPTTRRARADWAISHVFALPEMWAIVAEHSGVVGAWRLTGVCRVARVGAKEWLRTLPGLVVCGGYTDGGGGGDGEITSDVWRLDLGELRWERMPSLTRGRYNPACCAVRGGVVVLGGVVEAEDDESQTEEAQAQEELTSSVEILGFDSEAGVSLFSVTKTYFCPLRTTTDASPSVYPNTPTPKAPLLSPHPLQKETFSPPLLTASTSNVTTHVKRRNSKNILATPPHRVSVKRHNSKFHTASPLSCPPHSRSDTP